MGRRPTIDKERVLQVAESIVSERGAAALTIEAVAKAAGITKGGVQSSFGTKEALISAMLDRWNAAYQASFDNLVNKADDPVARTLAHSKITFSTEEDVNKRAATLLAALLQTPQHLEATRAWYGERLRGISGQQAPKLLTAFLATEGAFLLRYLGLVDFDEPTWSRLADEVVSLINVGLGADQMTEEEIAS